MKPWEMMQRFGAVSAGGGGGGDPVAASILAKLTSWWEMGEASGTRNDSKGTNHLSAGGTTSTDTGVRGVGDVAAAFAGAGGLYVDSNSSVQVPSGGGNHCMFGWVYLTANTGTQIFFAKWDDVTTAAPGLEYQGAYASSNYYGQNGGTTYYNAAAPAPLAGAWHFYVMWRDSSDGKVRVQVDNGIVYESTSSSDPAITSARLYFGTSASGGNRLTGRLQRWGWIKGAILTAGERSYLYNSGAGRTFAELSAAAA